MTDNTVVFTGINDQTVFNTPGVGFFRNIIIDKTEWSSRNFSEDLDNEASQTNQDLT